MQCSTAIIKNQTRLNTRTIAARVSHLSIMCARKHLTTSHWAVFYSPTPRCNRRGSCRPCQRPGGNKERRLTAIKQCPVFPPTDKELRGLREYHVSSGIDGDGRRHDYLRHRHVIHFPFLYRSFQIKIISCQISALGSTDRSSYRSVPDTRYIDMRQRNRCTGRGSCPTCYSLTNRCVIGGC